MARDKIQALSAPPGHSFTGEPGKWAWEQPSRFSDPNDAIDFIIDKLKEGEAENDMIRLMAAGITVEELVAQVSLKGFMQGAFNPDVAELIKPAIASYFMKLGIDNGFTPTLFLPKESDKPQVDDAKFFKILKERNPEVFHDMNEKLNRDVRMGEEFAIRENIQEMDDMESQDEGSFVNEQPAEEDMVAMEQPVEEDMVAMEQPVEEDMVAMEEPAEEEIV